MATATRTTVTLRNSRRRPKFHSLFTLAVPSLLLTTATGAAAIATTSEITHCTPADFLFPTPGLKLAHRDTIDVAYRSNLDSPTLSCWCGAPARAILKFRDDHAGPFNGSTPVILNFSSDGDPCWFELTSNAGDCRHSSEPFFILTPESHAVDDDSAASPAQAPIRGPSSSSTTTTSPLTARSPAAVDSQTPSSGGDSFSTGAKAALGIGVALTCIAVGAMASFLYFRRRRRGADAELSAGVLDEDRRGRKRPEQKRASPSETSGQSEEPLCPIEPVFDGFPGSTGYEDVRSLHSTSQALSTHSTHSQSPTNTQSPTHSQGGNVWTYERSIEREELTAARLKSQLQPSAPTVISYGPNPVTPTLTPRFTPRLTVKPVTTPVTPSSNSGDQIPGHVPMMPLPSSDYSDYNNYSIPPPAPMPVPSPDSKPSPPHQQSAIPIVVSYGPNRVTPTPLVVSPTVPPDESIVNRRYHDAGNPPSSSAVSHERQFSWEADSPLLGASSMGPLPPYATTADFEAMEKGAVRKLAEPQAQAELPPTKDGFYHYTSDVVEYELPGAGAQHGPQLPFRPYGGQHQHLNSQQSHQQGPGQGRQQRSGPGQGQAPGGREINEQKVLLEDVELMKLMAEKKKRQKEGGVGGEGSSEKKPRNWGTGEEEEYDLGEGTGR
ncbi:uncharacterized protein C8A04DRAFT_37122 [Dichotomopilus funicola]|uniref:Uncharacterized protein n=1 Tax=Dichotomopilus funicola TaxID=1934379 RepID=A0AAN6V5H6_9PEZI|nr:hypothetical protein C8A04DRAFT_37122 [Dichotomopilus funicola]